MSSGERPIGATKGKQSDTEALCQPPPPPPSKQHLSPSSACVQAALSVGSVNFRNVDLAVHFSIGPAACHVCRLIPCF